VRNADTALADLAQAQDIDALKPLPDIGQALEPAKGLKEDTDLGGGDDPTIWAKRLAGIKENVMLVGHIAPPPQTGLAAVMRRPGGQNHRLSKQRNRSFVPG
jgi:hypothetical protein